MTFYGSSFIAEQFGEKVAEADRESETVLTHRFDLDEVARHRDYWCIFRDRRPEHYGVLRGIGRQVAAVLKPRIQVQLRRSGRDGTCFIPCALVDEPGGDRHIKHQCDRDCR